MKQDIHAAWGSIFEFNNPMDFFTHNSEYWKSMIYDRQVLVFKGMDFTKVDFVAFCSNFGDLWSESDYHYSSEAKGMELVDYQSTKIGIVPFSNIRMRRLGMDKMPWHADIPNRQIKPFPMRTLWMVNNPNPDSGITTWLNIEHGINLLPDLLKKQISDIKIVQQSWYNAGTEVREFDFIKHHPVTGAASLRLNFYCDPERNIRDAWIKSVKVCGKLLPPKEILKPYFDFLAAQPELVYTHRWDVFDIVVYDNWPFVHKRTPLVFDPTLERLMYRTNIDHNFSQYNKERIK